MRKSTEKQAIAVKKLELKLKEKFIELKSEMFFSPIKARIKIEKLRKSYLLKEKTIEMFIYVGMVKEYTSLLNSFNKVLDGDLT